MTRRKNFDIPPPWAEKTEFERLYVGDRRKYSVAEAGKNRELAGMMRAGLLRAHPGRFRGTPGGMGRLRGRSIATCRKPVSNGPVVRARSPRGRGSRPGDPQTGAGVVPSVYTGYELPCVVDVDPATRAQQSSSRERASPDRVWHGRASRVN